MYENDASYVIIPEHLAGERFIELLIGTNFDFKKLSQGREEHKDIIGNAKINFIK